VNEQTVIRALALPEGAVQARRVPKKLLMESGTPTTADRRLVADGVEELQWVSALKPSTCGVAAYEDEQRAYLEIAVLTLALRPNRKARRLVELVHRAIPYPVVLVSAQEGRVSLSLSHLRKSQAKSGMFVLDGPLTLAELGEGAPAAAVDGFLRALALAQQPAESLRSVYDGWMEAVVAYEAALVTGVFGRATSPGDAAARREALEGCARLEAEMRGLRTVAKGEARVRRLVELNLKLKELEAAYAAWRARL